MNAEERCQLAKELYEFFSQETESFDEQKIGVALAYLLGTIVQDIPHGFVLYADLPAYQPFHALLKKGFRPDHVVWTFVKVDRWND